MGLRSLKKLMLVSDSIENLNPWAVTGLTDAEGYFGFTITKKSGRKLAFELKPRFSFHMHSRDYDLLVNLKEFFGVGNVSLNAKSSYYSVGSKEDIAIIIQHFKLFPLLCSCSIDKCYNFSAPESSIRRI